MLLWVKEEKLEGIEEENEEVKDLHKFTSPKKEGLA